ncbi:MAG: hypothetical protein C5B52_17470 [Bacteroidetes bacterium]|nr:MAG: hypothetical protein C5B52_17470 [Bacteroidota bacterium]
MNFNRKNNVRLIALLFVYALSLGICQGQDKTDSIKMHPYKNIVRYNLSGALVFGADRYIVFGYERVIRKNQSISINFGKASLPKLITVSTDSLELSKNSSASGYNVSIDYRVYISRENKYPAPHGLYIGPYYSYNKFTRDNQWDYIYASTNNSVMTHSTISIHTIGFELGYQFIFWKRLTLDLLMVGPGIGIYDYKNKIESNVDPATREQLIEGFKQLLTQKFPGMNFVFANKEIDSNGSLNTTSLGYRYLIQIGINF